MFEFRSKVFTGAGTGIPVDLWSAILRIEPTPLPPGVRVRKARFINQSQDFSKSVLIGPFLDVICMI